MQKMKKLLIFHPIIAPYRIDFFNCLSKVFDTEICLYQDNLLTQKFDYSQIEKQLEFKPTYLKKIRFGHRTLSLEFWSKIRNVCPDIVLTTEFGVPTVMVLLYKFFLRKQFKIIAFCDDSYDMLSNTNDIGIMHSWARKIIPLFLDDLILVEPRAVQWYQKHFNKGFYFPIIRREDKLQAIYKKVQKKAEKTKLAYHLDGKFIFLFVGRLVDIKNVDMLICSFKELDTSESSLVIVGDGAMRNNLEKLSVDSHSDVIFTGRLEGEDLYQWYTIADCFVLPSYLEPFGAVTNEALIAGCWCLISKNAGSQCLIKAGINGYTFDPKNQDDLTEKMRHTLQMRHQINQSGERSNRMIESFDERFASCILHLSEC